MPIALCPHWVSSACHHCPISTFLLCLHTVSYVLSSALSYAALWSHVHSYAYYALL